MSSITEQIKERLDIVDVLSSYIKVEKAGINFRAKCPFHNEKTPSFFISPTRQSFYCFGCGEKGDIFTFVEKFEGLDFKGALESLAKRAGVELKNFKREESGETDRKEKLFELMEQATKFYEEKLGEAKREQEYLKKRGLSEASIRGWHIGFAPDGWRNLHDYLIGKGFSKEDLFSAGLIKKSPAPMPEVGGPTASVGHEKFYDTFRDRIMFPISDAQGRVIAFSGRSLSTDENTPKYLNSPETKLFYKSEVLYGFHVAKKHIRKLDYAVLVEGQMDTVMSHQAGVLNTVASSGTAVTELHLRKIQKLSNRIVIAYDSDAAGEKAAGKAAVQALSLGMETKTVSLPEGEDPASVAAKNPGKWKEALRRSEHFVDFALRKSLSEKKNPAKEVIKNVLPLLTFLKSEIEKSSFIKKMSLEMGVPEEAILDDLKKVAALPASERKELRVSDEIFQKRAQVINLNRIAAGLAFLEESAGRESGFRKKWEEVSGKDTVEETLETLKEEKEVLIFEAENNLAEKSVAEIGQEVIERIELQALKRKLQTAAVFLDKDISKNEEAHAQTEIQKIQKRIKELNN